MATLTFANPDGSQTSATVDDSIMQLPADKQQATIDEIHQHALTQATSSSFTNDLRSAGNSLINDAGSLVQGVGSAVGSDTIKGLGTGIRNAAPTVPEGYQNRGANFTSNLAAGNYGTAVGDLAHGVAGGSGESLAELGGAAAGGALGTLAGPEGTAPGAMAGAGLVGGAFALGRGGRLRAGQNATSGANLAAAAPAAAGEGLVDALTLPAGGSSVARIAKMALGGGANSAIDQYDTSGTLDPSQVINSAATGAATGALAEGKSALGRSVGRAADNIQSRGAAYQPVDAQQAATFARTRNAVIEAQKAPDAPADLNKVANNLKSSWVNDTQDRIAQMKAQGASAEAVRDAASLLERAQRHNNVLYAGDLETLDQGEHGLSEAQLQGLKDRLIDLNTLSTNSFKNKNTGPLQGLGSKLGGLATTAGLLYSGMPGEAAMNLLAGSALENKVGARIGAAGDRLLGIQRPALMLQGQAADRMLPNGQPAPVSPITPTDTSYVSPSAALARLKAAQASRATQTSKANTLRQAMVAQGQQNLPQSGLTTPAPALMKVPYEPPAQPSLTTPAPSLMKVPYEPPAQPSLTTPAPALMKVPFQEPAKPGLTTPAPPLMKVPFHDPNAPVTDPRMAGLTDVHGRTLANEDNYTNAGPAYWANVAQWAKEAEQEHPGLGASVHAIAAAHDTSSTPPSADPAVKEANRAAAKVRTKQLKANEAIAQSSLHTGASDALVLKHLMRPALLNHG